MNMRPELERVIQTHQFGDYNQLTTLATDVEGMFESRKSSSMTGRMLLP